MVWAFARFSSLWCPLPEPLQCFARSRVRLQWPRREAPPSKAGLPWTCKRRHFRPPERFQAFFIPVMKRYAGCLLAVLASRTTHRYMHGCILTRDSAEDPSTTGTMAKRGMEDAGGGSMRTCLKPAPCTALNSCRRFSSLSRTSLHLRLVSCQHPGQQHSIRKWKLQKLQRRKCKARRDLRGPGLHARSDSLSEPQSHEMPCYRKNRSYAQA